MANEEQLYEVTYLGKDDQGYIVKGVKIMATSEDNALEIIKDIRFSTEVYSAILISNQ